MDIEIKWEKVLELQKKHDKRKFLDEYLKWGRRFIRALKTTEPLDIEYEDLVVVGMGGSGIVGDILKDYLGYELGIKVEVLKTGVLPNYISKKSLMIAISFSGNTIETLTMVIEALKRKIKVIGVTTGGKLQEYGENLGFRVYLIEEASAPRAGLPQLLGTTLKAITEDDTYISRWISIGDILNKESKKLDINRKYNKAFKLAYYMWGREPVFYGNFKYRSVLHRAKSSLNENAKINSYYIEFPEGYHNEVEAYNENVDPVILPIILKDKQDDLDPFLKHLKEKNMEHIIVELKGEEHLEKILRAVLLLDISSIYLAYLRMVDPFEIKVINKLKSYRGGKTDEKRYK